MGFTIKNQDGTLTTIPHSAIHEVQLLRSANGQYGVTLLYDINGTTEECSRLVDKSVADDLLRKIENKDSGKERGRATATLRHMR